MSKTAKNILTFVVCLAAPLGLGFLSSLLSGDIRAAYDSMVKAPLSPPGWLFGVVWPVLYILMGIAVYLVATSGQRGRGGALGVFAVQLVMNFAWSLVFFRFRQLWAAVVIVALMDILVLACVLLFLRHKRAAGVLMIPYLLWLLFATYLSVSFAILN